MVFRSSFFVHYNDAFIVLNANSPRWELCFLPPIRVERFNRSIWVHPSLVLWSMNLSLPISKLHHLFPMSVEMVSNGVNQKKKRNKQERHTLILLWYLDNGPIWKNALISTIRVENLNCAIWEGYFPCTIRMMFF